MRRIHSTPDTVATPVVDGGTTTNGFVAAYRRLADARARYDVYHGDAEHIRELSAARFELDDARRELAYIRLQNHTV
jgi:predicted component of type VI protein secretion system